MESSIYKSQLKTVGYWDSLHNAHSSEVVPVDMDNFMCPADSREQAMSTIAEAVDLKQPHAVEFRHNLSESGEDRTIEDLQGIPFVALDIHF